MDIRIEIAGEIAAGFVNIDLFEEVAPNHVTQIVTLVEQGAYDGVVFHRVIDGFMAQTGDVQYGNIYGDLSLVGTGGSDLPDLAPEFSEIMFDRGVVGMARAQDPSSANSQFFIMLEDGHFLNGQYTVVGRVTSGMDIIDDIKLGEGGNGAVLGQPDFMRSVTVVEPPDVPETAVVDAHWVLEGIDLDGNTFTGGLVFDSQSFDLATGNTALTGHIDWLANESFSFTVDFRAQRHSDGRLEFNYTENNPPVSGVVPALYKAQFSEQNKAISAYYDDPGVVEGTWWAMPKSVGILPRWSKLQEKIKFEGGFGLAEFDAQGELSILSEMMRLYHESPTARRDLNDALLNRKSDVYMKTLEIGAVADGTGSKHFPLRDSNQIFIDPLDPVARTFLSTEAQPIKLSLGSIVFHEFRHAYEDYATWITERPEVEVGASRFDDPDFDHLGSVVRSTNEVRAELGEELRGSYGSLTNRPNVIAALEEMAGPISALPVPFDQVVHFRDPSNDMPVWSSVGTIASGHPSKDFVIANNKSNVVKTGGGIDVVLGIKGALNAKLGSGNDWAFGSSKRDTIEGGSGRDTIDPGAGRDTLSGGRGPDDFIFGDSYGVNRILDFNASSRKEDIDLSSVSEITGYRDLVNNHLSQVRGNAVIDDFNGTRIILVNTDLADLDRSDFIF